MKGGGVADFVTVGSAEDVPDGEMRMFQVGGEDVAVANVEGEYFAFGDVCTHRQCSLSEGDIEDTSVICACHGSTFDMKTGEVLAPPATEPIVVFEVRVEGGELQVAP
jgi:3-phenylpropionate/trans-cinnamate dioxygenase ferredoxin subunit